MYGYDSYEIVEQDQVNDALVVRLIFVDEDSQSAELHTISPLSFFKLEDEDALTFQIQNYAAAYVSGLRVEQAVELVERNEVPDLAQALSVVQELDLVFKDLEYSDIPIKVVPVDDVPLDGSIDTP
jgi:hypothetical protein